MGLARPRWAISRLRVKESKRSIVPLSIDEVARFWSSFRTTRDLAIVGLMLLQGLRSAEVLALNPDDVLLSEAQVRVRGKGNKLRFLPLAPETVQLLDHYMRLERPNPCSAALFVSLKGPARGARMTPAGLRSLFRYHRRTTGIQLANPHRFRHTFASDMVRAGDQPACAHAVDGPLRYPNYIAICSGHSTRRLPRVCARRGPAYSAPSGELIVNRARRPPLQHPLADPFDRAVASLGAALNPETTRHYRGTVRNFLSYLGADHPEVDSPRPTPPRTPYPRVDVSSALPRRRR